MIADPDSSREHYAAIVVHLRALEMDAMVVPVGEQFAIKAMLLDPEGAFALWANGMERDFGQWRYSTVVDGMVAEIGTEVAPHTTDANDMARIVATWDYQVDVPPDGIVVPLEASGSLEVLTGLPDEAEGL